MERARLVTWTTGMCAADHAEARNTAAVPPPSFSPVRRCHSSLGHVRQGTPAAAALSPMASLTLPGTESARRTFLGRCNREERTSSTGCCPVTHMPSCPPPRAWFFRVFHLGREPPRGRYRGGGLRDLPPHLVVIS